MPRIDERTYAFYGPNEKAADDRFNELLDEGHSIPAAIDLVIVEFGQAVLLNGDLIGWWLS